jgi:hypothetical protein
MDNDLTISKDEVPSNETKSSVNKRSKSSKRSRKRQDRSQDKSSEEKEVATKKPRRCLPLNGMVVSVSTLIGDSGDKGDIELSFNSVSLLCKELGADVKSQVCKRVQILICTQSAVKQATQRVRKAFKKKIPLVDVSWLEKCRKEQKRAEFEPYLLDKEAEEAIKNRQQSVSEEAISAEVPPDTGWSEPVALGCCCVCHENGTEQDCKWCDNCAH